MKLLLTSAGLTNDVLKKEFLQLIVKPLPEIKLAFINTASKVEKDASYLHKDLESIKSVGIKNAQVIDIAEPQDSWIKILLQADVYWVAGGNTFYLLDKLRSSGLQASLVRILQSKVYVGVSAGSIIVTPTIAIAAVPPGDPNDVGMTDFTGLGIVDFEVSPHTPNSVAVKKVEQYAKKTKNTVYAYDDESAVLVVDGDIKVVGEGFNKIFNLHQTP